MWGVSSSSSSFLLRAGGSLLLLLIHVQPLCSQNLNTLRSWRDRRSVQMHEDEADSTPISPSSASSTTTTSRSSSSSSSSPPPTLEERQLEILQQLLSSQQHQDEASRAKAAKKTCTSENEVCLPSNYSRFQLPNKGQQTVVSIGKYYTASSYAKHALTNRQTTASPISNRGGQYCGSFFATENGEA